LSSNRVDDEAKLEALKFLGHWVGDVHQPLHVSFEDDRGGNNITAVGECQGNLHAAWDSCLVLKAVGEDVDQASTELMKSITPAKIESWTPFGSEGLGKRVLRHRRTGANEVLRSTGRVL
jgi:S1/P1 Nuclease